MKPNELLTSFSAYTNGKQLFDTTKETVNAINCLDGLRSLSLFWIIFGHRLMRDIEYFPIKNRSDVMEHYSHVYSTVFTKYDMSVDTFFVMGALLSMVSVLKAVERKKLNLLRLILHRYLRYTPVLAFLILYIVSISRYTNHGPISFPGYVDCCEKYWWSALLHIQNYVNPWYLCGKNSFKSIDC